MYTEALYACARAQSIPSLIAAPVHQSHLNLPAPSSPRRRLWRRRCPQWRLTPGTSRHRVCVCRYLNISANHTTNAQHCRRRRLIVRWLIKYSHPKSITFYLMNVPTQRDALSCKKTLSHRHIHNNGQNTRLTTSFTHLSTHRRATLGIPRIG